MCLSECFFLCVSDFQGDRFGGALDAAAKQFSKAFDSGMLPMEFVNKMKKEGNLIMGIGHRVKSVSTVPVSLFGCHVSFICFSVCVCVRALQINNPDMRVQILKDFVKKTFPSTQLLDYAMDVEKITTAKVLTLSSSPAPWITPLRSSVLNHVFSSLLRFQKPNLILNVDGFIGVAFVDLLRNCGGFTR